MHSSLSSFNSKTSHNPSNSIDTNTNNQDMDERMIDDHESSSSSAHAPSGLSQQLQQQPQYQQHPIPSAPMRVWPPVRSEPIAIARRTDEDGNPIPDDSDDESMADDAAYARQPEPQDRFSRTNASSSSAQNFTNSLPSRLLRAPVLGSLPTSQGLLSRTRGEGGGIPDTTLPPPMSLDHEPAPLSLEEGSRPSDATKRSGFASGQYRSTAYGSLRDSHSIGKFMDGPSSYRDGRTGDIHRLQHRVRFPDQSNRPIAASYSGSMSIGERMMLQTRKNKALAAANEKQKQKQRGLQSDQGGDPSRPEASTLSKLLMEEQDRSETQSDNISSPTQFHRQGISLGPSAFDEEDRLGDLPPSYMLSTSLTGLEILQRGISTHNRSESTTSTHPTSLTTTTTTSTTIGESIFERDELPRDAQGNNALLARSLSDPNPRWRERAAAASTAPRQSPLLPSLNSRAAASEGIQPLFLLPPVNSTTDSTATTTARRAMPQSSPTAFSLENTANDGPGSNVSRSLLSTSLQQQQQQQQQPHRPSDQQQEEYDPDTECAFELDLE